MPGRCRLHPVPFYTRDDRLANALREARLHLFWPWPRAVSRRDNADTTIPKRNGSCTWWFKIQDSLGRAPDTAFTGVASRIQPATYNKT